LTEHTGSGPGRLYRERRPIRRHLRYPTPCRRRDSHNAFGCKQHIVSAHRRPRPRMRPRRTIPGRGVWCWDSGKRMLPFLLNSTFCNVVLDLSQRGRHPCRPASPCPRRSKRPRHEARFVPAPPKRLRRCTILPPRDQPVALVFRYFEFLDRKLDRRLLIGLVMDDAGVLRRR
jgi:hypothetical protein